MKYIDAAKLYAGLPGYVKGSDTSRAAAISMQESSEELRNRICEYVDKQECGATCDEMEVALNVRHQTLSARCSECALQGRLFDSGIRRPTRSRRTAKVWITEKQKRLF